MDERHKTTLKKVRLQLLEDLEVNPVLDYMFSKNIISKEHSDRIRAEKTRQKQAECLLDILPRRGSKAFNEFYHSIRPEQGHLREALDEAYNRGTCITQIKYTDCLYTIRIFSTT